MQINNSKKKIQAILIFNENNRYERNKLVLSFKF